jgi:CBS-domain-containing membrane protein
MRWKKDVIAAPLLEGALVLVISFAGWISHHPLVFASLGPTAFEIIESPERPSARPYNIISGNAIAVVAAFAALWLTNAWTAPSVSASGVPLARVWAAAAATTFTVFGTLMARATQPAALSTTLLISLGVMQTAKDGIVIMAAVLLMVLIGEPVRRWRAKSRQDQQSKVQT